MISPYLGRIAKYREQINRSLLIVVAVLYVLTIAIFVYPVLASELDMAKWWMIALNLLITSILLVLLC